VATSSAAISTAASQLTIDTERSSAEPISQTKQRRKHDGKQILEVEKNETLTQRTEY
jgi:hypothetical protein